MSLAPYVFRDWWDDLEFGRPSRLIDQHFGLGLRKDDLFADWPSLVRPSGAGYLRPFRNLLRQTSGSSNITADDKSVQVILDVQQFAPNEIVVKTSNGAIVVEGKHEEKQDEHGFVSRQFTRRYVLPKDVEIENITSSLSSDGVLTISVPKKNPAIPGGEKVVPIIQTHAPALKPAPQPSSSPASSPNVTEIKVQHQ
ncbi:protein lethal(2)essential for life [Bemisia tabaci]|uniref:protein lethal(2)essential for life n=1 Tax=Bemisia tabaci TaxID=7038 RepID=UPI0008F98B60|nr:PREDICTED: protein lethal(2)essential for life-like [Bemisia tabaci]